MAGRQTPGVDGVRCGEFDLVAARSLAPLVKARGFGMMPEHDGEQRQMCCRASLGRTAEGGCPHMILFLYESAGDLMFGAEEECAHSADDQAREENDDQHQR